MDRRARIALSLGALVLVFCASAIMFVDRWHFMVDQPPIDFEINWVAAHRLVDHEPLYDRVESHADGLRLIGPEMVPDFSAGGTYSSYIGTPATALFYTPFVPFGHDNAARLYRLAQGLLMTAAVVVTGFALPRRSRWLGWSVGAVALMVFWPLQESIGLGQVDGFVMSALAVGVWAVSRERWRTAGAALGIATLLKISPGLLLVYLVVRGMWKVVVPAAIAAGGLLVAAVAVGRPADLLEWGTHVAPKLSRGGLLVNNQSLAAWLARLFGHDPNWLDLDTDLGRWRLVAPVVVLGGTAAVFLVRRHRPFVLLELGAVILVALLAGPISWDHYPTWAILAIVLMADRALWRHLRTVEKGALVVVLTCATTLAHKGTLYPTPDVVLGDWTRRVESGSKTMALLGYLAVALWLLARATAKGIPREPSRWSATTPEAASPRPVAPRGP